MSSSYEDASEPLRGRRHAHADEPAQTAPAGAADAPGGQGLRRTSHRRRDSSGSSPGRTLYSLAESTKHAWERVKLRYSQDPAARTANMRDVETGYKRMDPLSSRLLIVSVTALLSVWAIYSVISSYAEMISAVKNLQLGFTQVLASCLFLLMVQVAYRARRPNPVYLLDFRTFKPPEQNALTHDQFMELCGRSGKFSDESMTFMRKLVDKSGLGPKTYVPDAFWRAHEIEKAGGDSSVVANIHNARQEAEMVMFGLLDDLFLRNNLDPKAVDILIVNCSLFNPTPSLSAMIVNKYNMKSTVQTYNLSGMGCSAGVIAVDLAKDLLQVHRGAKCVIVSTESITQNWYFGEEKSMLITNTLFRLGGAAILLSNRRADRSQARHQLVTTVRTHSGGENLAYDSVFQMEDRKGNIGVKLSKNIMDVAGVALKKNITSLAPLVFPLTVHMQFGIYLFKKKVLKTKGLPPFVPDFHKAFEHFCIHTGGRAVLDVFEKALSLSERDIAPSRYSLYTYGNVSSASIWYELEYVENSGRLRKGDRTWQIAFGSGFKCNSAVWTALKGQPEKRVEFKLPLPTPSPAS